MNACNSEEFSEQSKRWHILHPEQIIKRIDEIFSLSTKYMVEYLFIVVTNDLTILIITHPDEPKPLSLRYGKSMHSRMYSSR
jgi:hypothetical protein